MKPPSHHNRILDNRRIRAFDLSLDPAGALVWKDRGIQPGISVGPGNAVSDCLKALGAIAEGAAIPDTLTVAAIDDLKGAIISGGARGTRPPQSAEDLIELGLAQVAEGQFEEAQLTYHKALDKNTGSGPEALQRRRIHEFLAISHYRTGDSDKAISHLQQAIDGADPIPTGSMLRLVAYALEFDKADVVQTTLSELARIKLPLEPLRTLSRFADRAGQGDISRKAAQRVVAYPDHTPNDVLNLINVTRKYGTVEEAVEVAAARIPSDPVLPELHAWRTRAALEAGKFKKSADFAEQMIAVFPEDAEGHMLLGLSRLREGDFTQALDPLRQSLALRPDHPHCHFFLARTLHALKQAEAAKTHIDRALELSPENSRFRELRDLLS